MMKTSYTEAEYLITMPLHNPRTWMVVIAAIVRISSPHL